MKKVTISLLFLLPLLLLVIASVSASSYYTTSCNNCQTKDIDFNKNYMGVQKLPQTTHQNSGNIYSYNSVSSQIITSNPCRDCGTFKTIYVMRSPDVHYNQIDLPNPCQDYWPVELSSSSYSY